MSKKKNDTPTAVRVARWTALAAAVTSIGTIGNTFVEKRPWFLGGDDEKPAIVAKVDPEYRPKKFAKPIGTTSDDDSNTPPAITFSIPSGDPVVASINSVSLSQSSGFEQAANPLATDNIPPPSGAMPPAPLVNLSDYLKYVGEFIEIELEDRPVTFCTITGSLFLIFIFSIVEFFYRRKKKSQIMFDSTQK